MSAEPEDVIQGESIDRIKGLEAELAVLRKFKIAAEWFIAASESGSSGIGLRHDNEIKQEAYNRLKEVVEGG